MLENKRQEIAIAYKNKELMMHPAYCGFRLKPERILFYTYHAKVFSNIVAYQCHNEQWYFHLLSP
jgi:pyridoxamine 5'-phosphate oxidase